MNEQFKQRAHDKLEILRVMSPAQVTHDAMLRSLRDLLAHWAAAPDCTYCAAAKAAVNEAKREEWFHE